jgi:Cu+-exporting ATPase
MALVKTLSLGAAAFVLMLAVYFGVVSLVSGWDFALEQFADFWYFIIALALGFGIQVGLYIHLRQIVGQQKMSGKMVAATGTTSTAAMVSCCAHYLVNVLPVLGVTGFVTLVAQYQVQLFWLGLAVNLGAILYIAPKVVKAVREHRQCLVNT